MASADSDQSSGSLILPTALKILVAGGFGVGKTTMIGSVSEVPPLETEEYMTQASLGIDDLAGTPDKATTTVAMDFGRITIDPQHVLYLFGTPGQERFWFMWDDLSYGALGAVVLADPRRLADSFASVDFFEQRRIPFAIGVNCFYGQRDCTAAEINAALNLRSPAPVVMCDVRQRHSSKTVLLALLQSAKALAVG
ncbi:GTP-binding protein [Streptomyces sp. 4N509B]|uniref:GTP-binding protein n=1 Tax=Streptomyces sp. 4N509B TaxID=3457413 RepID=UPI003FD4B478